MKIVVEPYREEWTNLFLDEKKELEKLFDSLTIRFHHIGSTAIKGCSAKPVIDILGVTNDITQIETKNALLKEAGYTPRGEYGMRGRRYFRHDQIRLHIFEDTDQEVTRYLRFIAYLNAYPDKAKEYMDLKLKLAKEYPENIDAYTLGKESFIKEIDILAAAEKIAPLHYPSLGPRKQNWKEEEIIDALHVNMHTGITYFCKYIPTMSLAYQPDVTLVTSTVRDDTFNNVLATRFTETNAKARIAFVLDFYRKQNLPFAWWVSLAQDTPKNLPEVLEELGLQFKEDDIGMSLDLTQYTPQAPTHKIKRIVTHKDYADFAHVLAQIGVTEQAYPEIYSHVPTFLFEEGAPLEMYVLYDHYNRPITTGIVLFHVGVAGIYYISTVPRARKRGLGTAMMHHLLGRAHEKGYSMSTLAASSEGKRLYERLGFRPCCSFVEYG